ncbi:MAG: sigma 54-interacting transcriptional regulator [Deltaproteobacteria bacterium]|nr:sigma 54-interacting transcriptional regulator [Deltaproteobacteria bacterium]MBW2041118.1 sigma 54-interacting transcriptional regulator [Deltaproteobacteria bacterium]
MPQSSVYNQLSLSEKAQFLSPGILFVDPKGRIRLFNEVAQKIFGKSLETVLDRFIRNVFPELWPDIKKVLRTGQIHAAVPLKIGSTMLIVDQIPLSLDGSIAGVVTLFQNISEFEHLLSELASHKELIEEMDVIINSSYDGLWICDSEGRVLRVNRSSERMSGVKEEEVLGRNMQDLVREGIFDKSVTLEVLKNRTAVTLIQRLKDGRQVLVTGNPVFDARGAIRLVVTNARDISELNRLHRELDESRALAHEYRSELNRIHQHQEFSTRVVYRSPVMQRVMDAALKVAPFDAGVLITGESGVGKGLLVKIIHEASGRESGPLIHVNCGAIPESLIEAELFGYEGGAFTGAMVKGKPGYLELAHGGTLFLDEVGEIPIGVQAKLLRFLEDNQVTRVGATEARKIDVRVIAATNRNLEAMIGRKKFRKDLYFRLNIIPLQIPPLRERPEDIPPLIHFFLERFNEKYGCRKRILPPAVDALCRYLFPGNVRELANLLEQLVVLGPSETICEADLPAQVNRHDEGICPPVPKNRWDLRAVTASIEKNLIRDALNKTHSLREAAKLLGLHHSTLFRKIQRHGIDK